VRSRCPSSSSSPLGRLVGGAIATTTSPATALVAAGIVGGGSVLPILSRRMLALRV
jgi:hypothetical protein